MTAHAPAAELVATKPVARAAGGRDYLLLLFLSALWGWSFPLIKVGVTTLPPLWVASGRIGLGAIALLVYMQIRGTRLPRGRSTWLRLGYIGIVGNIIPFGLISWGEVRVPSGVAAILMAMVPMMVVVVAHFRLADEPLTFGKSLGVILGIIGTLVLIGPSAISDLGSGFSSSFAGELAILVATICYASSALAGRGLPPMPAESASGAMLLVAAPLGLIAASIIDPPWTLAPSAGSIAAVLTLGMLCTGLGLVLFFGILSRAGAGFASMNNFLVPPFSVVYGRFGMAERLPGSAFAAMGLILLGLAVQRLKLRRR
jgi:drug/metabolite transporter (DMT)-like permease